MANMSDRQYMQMQFNQNKEFKDKFKALEAEVERLKAENQALKAEKEGLKEVVEIIMPFMKELFKYGELEYEFKIKLFDTEEALKGLEVKE